MLSLGILMLLLSSCAKTNYESNLIKINLPEMPIAGPKVARELEINCQISNCIETITYLNHLYLFKLQYDIYREELKY